MYVITLDLKTVIGQMVEEFARRNSFVKEEYLWWGWSNIGMGCPETWSVHPWKCSKPNWLWSRTACCRWPCLSRGIGLHGLEGSSNRNVSLILWYCEYFGVWFRGCFFLFLTSLKHELCKRWTAFSFVNAFSIKTVGKPKKAE